MDTIARILAALVVLEGALALFFPQKAAEASETFSQSGNGLKRSLGVLFAAAGIILFYLTRAHLAVPLVHWIIAVYGIFLIIAGLSLAALPGPSGRVLEWFYGEKGPTSLIGAILLAAGITLFMLI